MIQSKSKWANHPKRVTKEMSLEKSRWAFLFLLGFIATQGYLIPVVALPSLNWAIWPNLPDIFGIGLGLSVFFFRPYLRLSTFNRNTLHDLTWMWIIFVLNFLFVTIPFSLTGEGIKFGGFTLILFAKMLFVYWAVAHIPLDKKRMQLLHAAALIAFLWLALSTLADRFSIIEIDNFVRHLPQASAGKWSVRVVSLNSTVSNSHGGTTVALLVIGALVIGTIRHKFRLLVEGIVIALSIPVAFISGSRQGLVRFFAFFATYFGRNWGRILILLLLLLILSGPIFLLFGDPFSDIDNPFYNRALERQSILIEDPFSNEGLSGRPDIWQSVIDTLNEDYIRWVAGYGIGNYVEYDNAAHNMPLQFLQDGGIVLFIYATLLWLRIFSRIWQYRQQSWVIISLTVAMFTSVFTSAIFYPNLATGWYLGLYFVAMHIMLGAEHEDSKTFAK
jgi:O-antigen ligase/polysaccharide polymerase Wzy-like membrane protein